MYDNISLCLGNVYNVTAYMEYHPGGWDELIKGAGRDATDLFNDAHRWDSINSFLKGQLFLSQNILVFEVDLITLCYSWVDYKALISVCLVGTFTTDDIGPEPPLKSISETPQEEDGKHDRIVDQYTLVWNIYDMNTSKSLRISILK